MVGAEITAAVSEVFAEMGDLAKITVRRYQKGITSTTVASGKQARLPIGSPLRVTGVMSQTRSGKGTQQRSVFLQVEAFGNASQQLATPADAWTVQRDNGPEIEITGKFERFGPAANGSEIWRAILEEGSGVPVAF